MSESVYAGLTSQTIDVFLGDSSSTTGGGLTGLAFNTASLTCYYRKGATGTPTAITLATQTVGGAWSSGGFVQVDSTNMPGVYRFDIPNVVVDTEGFATVYFRGAANLVPTAIRIDCRALPADMKKIVTDAQSATDLKDLVDTGYDPATHKVQGVVTTDTATAVTTVNGLAAGVITSAAIATDAIGADEIAAGAVTKIQAGLATPTNITAATGIVLSGVTHTGAVIPRVTLTDTTTTNTDMRGTDNAATAANLATVAGYLDTEIAAILADTNELQTDWANGGRLDLILDARASQTTADAILEDTGTTLPTTLTLMSGATFNTATDSLEAIRNRGDAAWVTGGGGGAGSGAYTVTITVNDGAAPLQNATVRLTEGVNTFTATTNVSGVATFSIDAATYSVAITKDGHQFTPTTLVIAGDDSETYSMTATVITPPTNPSLSAIEVLCIDSAGQPESGVSVDIRIITVPTGSQNIAFKGTKQTATSDIDGIARFEVVQGSVCEWKRGLADVWQPVSVDADGVTNVTSVIGSP